MLSFTRLFMKDKLKSKFISEIVWLIGVFLVAAAVEYAIIVLFNLHPIMSVKIQGLIVLVIVAYIIRMITRMSKEGMIFFEDDKSNETDQP